MFLQLVHGPCSKTRVAYILSLLREQQAPQNDGTLLEEEEEESDEEGDITMFDPEVNPPRIDSFCFCVSHQVFQLYVSVLGRPS